MGRVAVIAIAAAALVMTAGSACSKKSSSNRAATAPLVTNVVPPSGLVNAATPVTITGSGFNGALSVALDDLAATPLTGMTVVSGTEIQATVPAAVAAGFWNVQVTTPSGVNATSTPRFRVVGLPTVTNVAPSSGMDNVATAVTITGMEFVSVSAVGLDDPATTALTAVTTVNDTTITASVPQGITPGLYNVRVTTPAGTNLTSAVQYQVISSATPPPTVTLITPSTGSNVAATPVTVDGTNFIGTVSARLDDLLQTALTGVSVISPNQLTANVPPGIPLGIYEVRVTADGGTSPVAGVTFDVTSVYTGPAIYVTQSNSNDVLVVNLTTRLAEFTIPVGISPSDIAISPDESRVYVTNTSSGTVSVIDTATNTVSGSVTVGGGPAAVDFSPSGLEAYVANSTTSNVSVINATNDTWIVDIAVTADPGELEFRRPQGDEVWVLCSGSAPDSIPDPVDIIDPTSRTVVGTVVDVGVSPLGITFDQTGNTAYVANNGNLAAIFPGDLAVVDVASRTVTGTVGVLFPFEIARVPGSDKAYLSDATNADVLLFDTSTGLLTGGSITLTGGISLPFARYGFAPATSRAFVCEAQGVGPILYTLFTIDTTTDTTVSPSLSLTTDNPPIGVVVKEN